MRAFIGLLIASTVWTSVAAETLSVPSAATDAAKAQRDAKNWEVLHSMYPKRALEAREQGLVAFTVKIDPAGSPTECQVTHSSGHRLLDEETCKLIMVYGSFKRSGAASSERTYEGVVNWKLPDTPAAAIPAPPKPIDVAAAPEKLVCKRTARIGTLAGFERTCMTQRQWERAAAETQDWWTSKRNQGQACEVQPGGFCGNVGSSGN